MKNVSIIVGLLLIFGHTIYAQKYFTRDGKISFYSEAPLENIEAHNQKATSVLDAADGKMEFAVLIKAFQFEKALMQEHFNENYMESSKFPKATFKGSLLDPSAVNFDKDGTYTVEVKGDLTIHGVTKEVQVPGTFVIKDGKISAKASFEVAVADYKIEIPAVVRDNIAKTVEVKVDLVYEPLKT